MDEYPDVNSSASFLYPHRYGYFGKGTKVSNQTDSTYGVKYSKNDVVSTIINFDESTISFSVNGVHQGVAFRDLNLKVENIYFLASLVNSKDEIAILNDDITINGRQLSPDIELLQNQSFELQNHNDFLKN